MTILGIARNAAKQQQAIQDRMSETFLINDLLPNFAFSSIPMTINVQGSKKRRVPLICLDFFSFLFMGASSKYEQRSRRDQCAVYNRWVISDISWLSWSCQEKSFSGHKIDLSLPPPFLPLSIRLPPSICLPLYPSPIPLPLYFPSLSTGVSWVFRFSILGLEHFCTCS